MHNQVEILGYLGKDPETRETPTGKPYCIGSMATSYKVQKTGTEETTWFRLSAWGGVGKILFERGKKGGRLFVRGRLRPMEYETDRGFFRGYEVMVDILRLLD